MYVMKAKLTLDKQSPPMVYNIWTCFLFVFLQYLYVLNSIIATLSEVLGASFYQLRA